MVQLGLEVPKEAIDGLFDEWDADGGGSLEFKELSKILSSARSPPPLKQAATVAGAAAKMKGLGSKTKASQA